MKGGMINTMYQAYAGRVLNGKPVILETVKLPENANLIITVLDSNETQEVEKWFTP